MMPNERCKLLVIMNTPPTRVYKYFSLVSNQVLYQQRIEYLQYDLVNVLTSTVLNHIYTIASIYTPTKKTNPHPPNKRLTVRESTNYELRLKAPLIKRPIIFYNAHRKLKDKKDGGLLLWTLGFKKQQCCWDFCLQFLRQPVLI